MYFASRTQAGRMLGQRLKPKYASQNCVVIALNQASKSVAAEIAKQLNCPYAVLDVTSLTLPVRFSFISENLSTRELLKDRNIVLAADGLKSGNVLSQLSDVLDLYAYKQLVLAVGLASFKAVDAMHAVADELHCLVTHEGYSDTSHYYLASDSS